MGLGSVQTFCPTTAHGACNAGTRSRVHLILDVHEDEHLKKLRVHAKPLSSVPMPALSARDLAQRSSIFARVLCRDEFETKTARMGFADALGACRSWTLFRIRSP